MQHRKSASWLYMSRLAALKEYAFMQALYDHGFPVPRPVDSSRHCVIMSLAHGFPMCQVAELRHPGKVYSELMNLIIRLAQHGLIHCDFNEFNLMIDEEENVTLIDFPQMVSTTHENAEFYFDRDVQCIRTYFERRYNFVADYYPRFSDYTERTHNLDVEVEASGFDKSMHSELESFIDRDHTESSHDQEGPETPDDEEDEEECGEETQESEEDEQGGFLLPEDEEQEEDEPAPPSRADLEKQRIERQERLAVMRRKILEQQRAENSPDRTDRTEDERTDGSENTPHEQEEEDSADPKESPADEDKETTAVEEENEEDDENDKKGKKRKAKKTQPASSHVRNRVKQSLARRNKPKHKPNSNKSQNKRRDKMTINEERW